MSARRTVRWACHWTVTLLTAAIASLVAPIPFTGPLAAAAGALAAGAVCLIGLATAPNITRKDMRP